MRIRYVLGSLAAFLWLLSCSSSKNVSSVPMYTPEEPLPLCISQLNINYRINKLGVRDTFNKLLDDIFKQPMTFPEYSITTKIKRMKSSAFEIDGSKVLMVMPLDIDVIKTNMIKDIKVKGELEITLITELAISPLWDVATTTKMTTYTWTKKPKVDLGIIDLPIESIANLVISRIKQDVEQSIDKSLKEQFDLKTMVKDLNQYLSAPYQLDSVFGGWMQMRADTAYFSGGKNTQYYTEGKIGLRSKMAVTTTMPQSKPTIPAFKWNNAIADSSDLNFLMEIEYEKLNEAIYKNFVGKTYTEGDKSITLQGFLVYSENKKLVVAAKTVGAFNGDIIISGNPYYDPVKQELRNANIDVSIKTGNLLHKAAAWILKGKIKSELDKMMVFQLKPYLENAQIQIDNQVAELNAAYKMKMKANLGKVTIEVIQARRKNVIANLHVKMKIQTDIDDMHFFQPKKAPVTRLR